MKKMILILMLIPAFVYANCEDSFYDELHNDIVKNIHRSVLSLGLYTPSYIKVLAMAKMAGAETSFRLEGDQRLERQASSLYFRIERGIAKRFGNRYNRYDLYRVVREGFHNGDLCPDYRPFNVMQLRIYINQKLQ